MKKTKLTHEEILEAEKFQDNRKRTRAIGFQKMHERDQAVATLSNGAQMLWHVDKELNRQVGTMFINGKTVEIVTYPPNIPEDSFGLVIDGKTHIFNTEEFRRWLRWC